MIKNKNFYRWGTNLFTQLNMNLFSCFERCSALSFRQDRGDVALPEVTESSVLLTCRGEQHAWNQEDHQHDGNHASLCCCPLAAPGAEAGGRTAQLHSVREDPSSDCNPHAPPPTDTHTLAHFPCCHRSYAERCFRWGGDNCQVWKSHLSWHHHAYYNMSFPVSVRGGFILTS